MDLVSLKAFVQAARLGSLTAAAGAMHLSQPAVSGHIRRLEEALGLSLLYRSGSGVSLTADGEQVLPMVNEVIRSVAHLQEFAGRLSGVEAGTVVVGCGSIQAASFMPPVLSRFAHDHPDVEVRLRIGSSAQTLADLRDNRIHMGIVSTVGDRTDVHSQLLYEEAIVLIGRRRSAEGPLTVEHLRSRRLVLFAQGSGFRRFVDAFLESVGMQPRSTIEIDDIHVMIKLVEQGIGLALVPASAVQDRVEGDLLDVVHPDEALRRRVYLVWDAKRPLSHADERLIEYAQVHARGLDGRTHVR